MIPLSIMDLPLPEVCVGCSIWVKFGISMSFLSELSLCYLSVIKLVVAATVWSMLVFLPYSRAGSIQWWNVAFEPLPSGLNEQIRDGGTGDEA